MNPRLLRPTPTGFDPRRIAGIEAWWDAADSSRVTLDSGRVSVLADKSGKGRNAENTTSGSTQPDYITAAHNGRNAVRFAAASSQVLTVPSSTAAFNYLHNGTSSYVAVVARVGDTDTPNAAYGIMGNNQFAATNIGFGVMFDDRSAFSFSKRFRASITAGGSVNNLIIGTNNAVQFNTLRILEMQIDADNATAADRLEYRFNGGTSAKGNTQTGAVTANNASQNFRLGLDGGSTLFLQGDICEVLMYSQQPTADAQTAIRRYLARKWGVTLA